MLRSGSSSSHSVGRVRRGLNVVHLWSPGAQWLAAQRALPGSKGHCHLAGQAASRFGAGAQCSMGEARAAAAVSSGSSGSLGQRQHPAAYARPQPKLLPLTPAWLRWFAARGISQATLSRNGIMCEHAWSPLQRRPVEALAFPYLRDGQLVNVKYRTLAKEFWQVKGAEKIVYGLDDVVGAGDIIVVEGEMDKLALEEAGYLNVVSVPDGAPQRVKAGDLPPPHADTKFSYLHACNSVLAKAARILLATDNDEPGQALAEELARRLGRERCWRVRWPADEEAAEQAESTGGEPGLGKADGYRKDANEVLMKDGPEALRGYVQSAEPYPIRGLFRFSQFFDEIWSMWARPLGDELGVSTGWKNLDEFYRVVPGELTIVTGVPNSGKSEWIDALLCNLAERHGWSFVMCSMEKKVTDHARQLLEKHVRKPFVSERYAAGQQRMEAAEFEQGLLWLDDCFHLIRYEDDELPSIDWVLDLARAAVLRYGIRGLVIDPYNELDHRRPAHQHETEYVSQMLTKIKRFAQHHDVHVWFVAHPKQLREWKGQAPNLYDISGSAHFINKCDNGIVIHRNRDPEQGDPSQVQVLVRKVRNKAAGTIGDCLLKYDRPTGRYSDWGVGGESFRAATHQVPTECDRDDGYGGFGANAFTPSVRNLQAVGQG
ncbi:hypothetical protein WJX72_005431 [[Myrmecia] bisecta]|uniref:SF4 helicase domain-containing protein n=1 Tax=[Myrmecia] bisecta TaxID=41462 RepID=A0AAW1PJY1_9CHLO